MNSALFHGKNDSASEQEMILEQRQIIEKKSVVIAQQKQRIKLLEEYLRLARQKQFGAAVNNIPGKARSSTKPN